MPVKGNAKSTAYAASLVVSGRGCTVYGGTIYNSKTASQFLQFHDSATLPSDTAVPDTLFVVGASADRAIDFGPDGRHFDNGCVICNSSTGPTKTIGAADCFFDIQFTQ